VSRIVVGQPASDTAGKASTSVNFYSWELMQEALPLKRINTTAVREYKHQYYLLNRQAIASRKREYDKKNAERIALYSKRYRRENLSKLQEDCQNKRRIVLENLSDCASSTRVDDFDHHLN
jgi:hypothetical protein